MIASPTNLKVTQLHEEHFHEAEHLLEQHPDIFAHSDTVVFRKRLRESLTHLHAKNAPHTLILIKDNMLFGALVYSKPEESLGYYKIEWFAVKKGEEGKGYGTWLMEEACSKIKNAGGTHVFVETSHEKHNEKAKRFYRKLGFHAVGILPDYYPPPAAHRKNPEDLVVYLKTL